jgi:cell wall-associated NlpC family hydrolase
MRRKILTVLALLLIAPAALPATTAHARKLSVPEWAQSALSWAVTSGHLERAEFRPNRPLARSEFSRLMKRTFGGGFARTEGFVTAGEVDAALVRALGYGDVARHLTGTTSPDGWDPDVGRQFGTEIVARELGLRHDRPTTEESLEASATMPMPQADVLYALWKAKTSPSSWGAETLRGFELADYDESQRKVIKFAFSLVGNPYVWGGEWASETPASYPYGAQPAGGFDCSGFSWFVLRSRDSSWSPPNRNYKGWSLPERASRDMAKAAPKKLRYRELRAADLLLFAPDGRRSKASSVYHAGIYLGKGWMIHSSGSRAGVSLAKISAGNWWHDQLAWGRRVVGD